MRIILVTVSALVLGSAFLHAEPARCQGGSCSGNQCFDNAGCMLDGCFCNKSQPDGWGYCVGTPR